MRWQSCGPSTMRLRWLLPWAMQGVGLSGRIGLVRVPGITADAVAVWGDHLVAPGFVAASLHEPIDDHQPVADFAEAGGLVEKRSLLDAGHPLLGVLLGNDGFEFVGLDLDGAVVLGHAWDSTP